MRHPRAWLSSTSRRASLHPRRWADFFRRSTSADGILTISTPRSATPCALPSRKLRYAGDFLFPILSKRKRARRFAQASSTMQDALGRANDMARTEDLLGQLAADTLPADANRAVGAVLAYQAAQARRQDRTLSKRWREFAGMDVRGKASDGPDLCPCTRQLLAVRSRLLKAPRTTQETVSASIAQGPRPAWH